jgi:transcriptional regulator with XRE-family HTH domain
MQPSSVGDWENDVSAPRGENLVRLARLLGVSESWIVGGDDAASPKDGGREGEVPPGRYPVPSAARPIPVVPIGKGRGKRA